MCNNPLKKIDQKNLLRTINKVYSFALINCKLKARKLEWCSLQIINKQFKILWYQSLIFKRRHYLAASPTQTVATSGRTCLMVSNMAIPDINYEKTKAEHPRISKRKSNTNKKQFIELSTSECDAQFLTL